MLLYKHALVQIQHVDPVKVACRIGQNGDNLLLS